MQDTAITVAVVIPAYNEDANIDRTACQVLREPWTALLSLSEVVVVDDCSTDRTYEIARALACQDARVRVVRHARRSGKNAGIRVAAAACKTDIVVVVDADVLLRAGSLYQTLALLAYDPSAMGASCIIEPLPAQSWRERASCSQALFVAELKRRGHAYLSAVYALRSPAFGALDIPDGVADDAYVTCWLRAHNYRYHVHSEASAYIRAATGLRDFAKQTLRGRHGDAATKRAVAGGSLKAYSRGIVARALARAFVRDPLGFALYVLWYGVILVTPTRVWLPAVSLSTFDTARSTKDLDLVGDLALQLGDL